MTDRAIVRTLAVTLAVAGGALGCSAILGLHDRGLESDSPDAATSGDDAGGAADGISRGGDGAAADGASEGTAPSACAFDSAGFGDVHAAGCWSTFDLTSLPGVSTAPGVEGVAFDGRYLYLTPMPGAVVLRYDTEAPFESASSWTGFDVNAKLGVTPRFAGAVFDGRYVTFVPYDSSPLVVRFDTAGTFTDAVAWSTFDPTKLNANATGFIGATFDGRYTYLVPRSSTVFVRHDTQAAFGAGWEAFDLANLSLGVLAASWGAVFDGHAVYLSPEGDGVAIRYDTAQPFSAASSYAKFDTALLQPNGLTFVGGAFDGRYVYLSPDSDGVVARYDTRASYTDAAAWALFDMGTLHPTLGLFSGAAYDGRFVYFTPVGSTNGAPNRLLGRYDASKPFGDKGSWEIIDCGAFSAGPFDGSAYDGRFVYFAPFRGGTIARFEARATPAKLSLPSFYGSFF